VLLFFVLYRIIKLVAKMCGVLINFLIVFVLYRIIKLVVKMVMSFLLLFVLYRIIKLLVFFEGIIKIVVLRFVLYTYETLFFE